MNFKHMEVSFWRHKSKRAGLAQLYCRIIIGGNKKDIGSTGITISWDHWNGREVTKDDPQCMVYNERLNIIRDHLNAIYNDLFRKKEIINAEKIKRIYLKAGPALSMLAVFELYLKDSAIDPERKLDGETVEVYGRVAKKLTKFLQSEKALDLPAEDFDILWAKKYRRWMATTVHRSGTGHAESYIIKQSQTIKNVLVWAKLHKYISQNPLDGMKLKGPEYDDPIFISEEQFQALSKHRFDNSALQETADVFLILCRTGFHYGDLKDLVMNYKTALRAGLDGEVWVMKDRIKNEVKIRVPLFAEVKQVVTKYGGWEQLPIRPRTKFNQYLKVVAAELKLPEKISSKAGRKTFTDWCYNVQHLSTDAVKVMLGRKSAVGLEIYGRPDERRVIAELSNSNVYVLPITAPANGQLVG